MTKQSFWMIVFLTMTVAFPSLGVAAQPEEGFSLTRIAPTIILPEKIGGYYFSQLTVISNELNKLETAGEENQRKDLKQAADTLDQAGKDKEAAQKDLEKAEQGQNADAKKTAQDKLDTANSKYDKANKALTDAKSKLKSDKKPIEDELSILLNSKDVKEINFSQTGPPADNQLTEEEKSKIKGYVFVGRYGDPPDRLTLWLPKEKFQGPLAVKLRIGDKFSQPFNIIVSRMDRWEVCASAAVVTIIVFGLPIILIGRIPTMNRKYTTAQVLLLDQETNTYSLSKFQFLLWTLVALFGYVFLTIAKSLVQGTVAFSDLPGNLPGIIAISAATGVLAPGVTAVRGAKGAGPDLPTPADLVTVGGVVVAERFQFFVWTIIGAGTFLFLILSTDPATIQDLPSIPERFLEVMGLSSFGYLAGKLLRKPGPIIDSISATVTPVTPIASPPASKLTVKIVGRKLSKSARFTIDGREVEIAKQTVPPKGIDPDEQAVAPDVYKTLELQIDKPDPEMLDTSKEHSLLITNPDGQGAEWKFNVN